MIKDALIIAAGMGSRLNGTTNNSIPKPLTKLCGLTLIERIMFTSYYEGIENFYISVGYEANTIINYLNSKKYPFNIEFINNDNWKSPNGYSVFCAKEKLKNKNFILLMSDHVFSINNLKILLENENRLVQSNNKNGYINILACDFLFQDGIDYEDVTKVKTNNNIINDIGKNIKNFNAYDTGLFLCSNKIFDYLTELNKKKDTNFSLTEANNILIKENKFSYVDIKNGFWQDIDTKEDLKNAEKKLLNSCRKATDGVVSKFFNRYISLFITKNIINTKVTPNMMTFLVLFIGILSSFLIANLNPSFKLTNYLLFFLGLILYKLTSIMDGCDGEIAKLKFMSSNYGAWLDTICDNLTSLFFLSSISYVFLKFNHSTLDLYIAILSPSLYFLTIIILITNLIFKEKSGSLVSINVKFQKNKLLYLLSQLCKRDIFTVVFVLLAMFYMFKTIIVLNIVFALGIIFISIKNLIK